MVAEKTASRTLCDYVRAVYCLRRRVAKGSAYQLRRSCESYAEFLGHDPRLRAISADSLSGWILALEDAGAAPATIKHQRGDVLCVLRDASRRGLCRMPVDVRPAPRVRLNPQGWKLEEFERLLAALPRLRLYREADRPLIRAILLVAWETGLRRSDLLDLRRSEVQGGIVDRTMRKTGEQLVRALSPNTLAAWESCPGDQPFQRLKPGALWKRLQRLAKLADVPLGGLQRVRRSAATDVKREGGDPQRFLAHRTPGLAEKHYVCRHLLPLVVPGPRPVAG